MVEPNFAILKKWQILLIRCRDTSTIIFSVYEYAQPCKPAALFLCLSVWMCLFFIPLSPHSLQNPVIFVFFCFITLPAVYPPLLYLGLVVFVFFSLPTFYCVIFSLYHSVLLLSSFSFSSLTPRPSCVSVLLLQQNKADIVLRDKSCSKLKYHFASDCYLDVLEILFFFFFFLIEKACGFRHFHIHTIDCFNFAQLSLHSFETSLIKEMDRCLAVFPLMERAFITLHV